MKTILGVSPKQCEDGTPTPNSYYSMIITFSIGILLS